MPLTGGPRVTGSRQDASLRKLSLQVERFTNWVLSPHPFGPSDVPHASRRVEAIVRPVSSCELAIHSLGTLDLTHENIVVDSDGSRDPAESTNGHCGVARSQARGDVDAEGKSTE